MKKTFQLLGLYGAIIWGAAVLIRELNLSLPTSLQLIIGVAPNFGVVWALMSVYVTFMPVLMKHESTRKGRYIAISAIFVVLLLSEAIHYAFLGAGFDMADMITSAIAIVPLLALNASSKQSG